MPKAKAVDPPRRPGSPHGTAGALPPHRWQTILVLPRSPGPSSAACIGSWHLNQFPVSLHLGRDQGAEGVQVTSLTAEIFSETKRTEDEPVPLRSRKGSQHATRAKGLLHRRTPAPRDSLLQAISQGPAGPQAKPRIYGVDLGSLPRDKGSGLSGPGPSPQDVHPGRSVSRRSHTCSTLASPNSPVP